MTQIRMVKIRAEIRIGSLVCSTPYILRFNVSRARGRPSTFDASLKVSNEEVAGNIVGDSVTIRAGEGIPTYTVFTGFVRQAQVNPCKDDPSFVILNLSGADRLSYLEGKKYTRRCRATRGTFITINDVQREGLKTGKLSYLQEKEIITDAGNHYLKDQHIQARDQTPPEVKTVSTDTSRKGVTMKVSKIDSGA